jgi:hypothetical protein
MEERKWKGGHLEMIINFTTETNSSGFEGF